MFVNPGARDRALAAEREKFLAEEWPRIVERIERLGLRPSQLLKAGLDETTGRGKA